MRSVHSVEKDLCGPLCVLVCVALTRAIVRARVRCTHRLRPGFLVGSKRLHTICCDGCDELIAAIDLAAATLNLGDGLFWRPRDPWHLVSVKLVSATLATPRREVSPVPTTQRLLMLSSSPQTLLTTARAACRKTR